MDGLRELEVGSLTSVIKWKIGTFPQVGPSEIHSSNELIEVIKTDWNPFTHTPRRWQKNLISLLFDHHFYGVVLWIAVEDKDSHLGQI